MARYVLLVVGLLSVCAGVCAQRWPAGVPGGEELSALAAGKASIAGIDSRLGHKKVYRKSKSTQYKHAYDEEEPSYKKKSTYEDKEPSYKKKPSYDDDEDKKPKYEKKPSYENEDDSEPYYKKDDKPSKEDKPSQKEDKPSEKKKPGEDSPYWRSYEPKDSPFDSYSYSPGAAKGAWNTAPEHVWEHLGPCIGSNKVTATGPANAACPGPNVLGLAQVSPCKVPEYCQNLPNGAEPCTCPTGEFARFDAGHVASHFSQQPGPFPMVDVRHSTYECVDARGFGPMIATPGGDLAELTAVAMALLKLTGKTWDKDIADRVFDIFADEVANPSRPLYFHTDDIRLRSLFKELRGKLRGQPANYMPNILPFHAPENDDDAELWVTNLKKGEFQGCGHIRLMIEEATRLEYSVSLAGAAVAKCPSKTASCVDSKRVAQYMIEKFFRYWWFSPSGSAQRQKIAFEVDGILQGPLLGKGVAVISNGPKDACPDHAPAIRPAFGGSQVFLYHGDAVGKWRTYVAEEYLGGLARKYDVSVEDLLATWNAITGQQLGATLANLVPANRVGLFSVEVPTVEIEEESGESGDGKY